MFTYNSWNKTFKAPFGAVAENTEVYFFIQADTNYREVYLCIHKDGGEEVEQAMAPQSKGYQTTFQTNQGHGLYFYYFKAIDADGYSVFYGNNQNYTGGLGASYNHLENTPTFQLTCYQKEDPAPNWFMEGIAYHIFVDRFKNGTADGRVLNPKPNAVIYTPGTKAPTYIRDEKGDIAKWDFFGGNLLGIIEKLDYLKELKVSILYLSPIFEARSNHKYDTGDYFAIDPMFGDQETFEKLVKKAGEKGIKIILDGVFNHTGADSKYFNRFASYPSQGAYQSQESPYANWFTFNEFPHSYDAWWGIEDLPTLNTEHPEVRDFIYSNQESVIKYWASKGIGGFRLDVADELTDEFLYGLRQSLEESSVQAPVLIGEVWEDASNKISYDTRRNYILGDILHGVMNYPFRDLIIALLTQEKPAHEVANEMMGLKENYPKTALYGSLNNIGSHDTIRIKTALHENLQKVKIAFDLMFALPGVPCIYYGDEAGLSGQEDPDNRRPYPWGEANEELIVYVKALTEKRSQYYSLITGEFYALDFCGLLIIVRHSQDKAWHILLVNPTQEVVHIYGNEIQQLLYERFHIVGPKKLTNQWSMAIKATERRWVRF